ncbi:pimeloyl-ACP methyl ester carboxylesterase [Arcticibacter pallidicorallinus]|uniref:Pimeloyl-ACP methyl ester carboxylesterase n=1 Tax=Arcticibacter pallidicorallinus TaxID=1259464 RepID=A0A2T0U3F6_9SPHI|nr:alpha/beta hydrolase [Arcticibacter pallidicorallinus]PRY52442.1 pimeloyl-ACP methyl ester carboxylesterase [Arcticibacter pallidicorallinus]
MIKEKQLEIDDLQVHYKIKEADHADLTVVFIHGFPFDCSIWDRQMEGLPDNVRGISYDIRGFGRSRGGHHFFSIDLFASDLIKFLKNLSVQRIVLCGVSMGGYIALRAVQRSSDHLAGLILCDTNASADSNEAKLKRFESIDKITSGGKAQFIEEFLKGLFSEKTNEENRQLIDQIAHIISETNDDVICAAQLAMASRTETVSFLPAISVPCLIIRGAEDQLMSMEQAEQMDTQLNSHGILEIAHAGHLPNAENPDAFNEAIINFLQAINEGSDDRS